MKRILTKSDKKALIIEREKAILESFVKTFNSIKRKDEEKLNEGKLTNFVAGLGLAAASCVGTSCKKENTGIGFDIKTQYTVTNTQTGEIKYGNKTSQGYAYDKTPTPEQLVILIAYQNIENETRFSSQRDKADFLLSGLELKEVPYYVEQGTNGVSITNDEFYGKALNFLKNNPALLQKELDELKSNGNHPILLGQNLINFDANSILNNPNNKFKSKSW
jgi:hypothetical protein